MRLSDDLLLPDDADTRRTVFLGMSGSGKTSGAKVLIEALIAAGRRVAILDPQGVFWGMRTSADGARAGLPFVVFGGRYGDIPLERSAGAAVADLVIDEGLPVILDLSAFEDDESILTVAADFVTRLRSRQNRDLEPVHLVADEADMLAPQMARRGAEDRCQRALRNVARRLSQLNQPTTCQSRLPMFLPRPSHQTMWRRIDDGGRSTRHDCGYWMRSQDFPHSELHLYRVPMRPSMLTSRRQVVL